MPTFLFILTFLFSIVLGSKIWNSESSVMDKGFHLGDALGKLVPSRYTTSSSSSPQMSQHVYLRFVIMRKTAKVPPLPKKNPR